MRQPKDAYVWQLFTHAYETNQVESIRVEMKKLAHALQEYPRFLDLLNSPAISVETKKEWLSSTLSDQVSDMFVDFLMTLTMEDQLDTFEAVKQLYDQIVGFYLEDAFNVIEGKVYTAISLTDNQLKKLVTVFTKKTGKDVRLEQVVVPGLIAGYRVELQDEVYDDTVSVQVEQLKESLKNLVLE